MSSFENVVKQIEESEKNVDKVLKAGRLERHERAQMSNSRLTLILNYAMYMIAMLLGFGLAYMIVYFMATA